MFTFTFDTSDLRKRAERLKKFRENDVERIFADAIITCIQMDSSRGKTFQQKPFAPYKPATIVERKKLKLQVQYVDLRRKTKDSLLDTLKLHDDSGVKIVRVDDDHEKIAEGLTQGIPGRMKARNFYGASPIAIHTGERRSIDRLKVIL